MIKGVIFDADGTLVDSMPMWKELDFNFLRKIGEEPDESYTDTVNKMTLHEGVQYTIERYHLSMTEEEIIEMIRNMAQEFYDNEVKLKPYVKEFLEALSERGIPMAIATSSQKSFIFNALKRNGAEHYFQGIFTCAETGINKQFPDVFLRACDCLRLKPEEAWVVEDAYHAVMTAKKAGFKTLAVYDQSNELNLEETIREADLYMEDLRDIDRFLQYGNSAG